MDTTRTVLLVENDEQSAADIQRFLKLNDPALAISHTPDMAQATAYVQQHPPALVLFSAGLLQNKSFDAFRQQITERKIPLILLTEAGSGEPAMQAQQAGAVETVVKNKINYFLLQKTIENVLKLNETVSRLDTQYSSIVTRHDSYAQLLQKLDAGVLVLSSSNQIAFANEKAYSIMADSSIRTQLSGYLRYRKADTEERIELQAGKQSIQIRISSLDWNGEPANLFFLERKQAGPTKDNLILQDEILQSVIHTISENVLLMKDNRILLANKPALTALKWKQDELSGKNLQDILTAKEPGNTEAASVQSFFEQKEMEGDIKLSDGSAKPVRYFIRPVNIADGFYQLLSFSVIENKAEQSIPKGTGDETLSNENVLHLASHDLREPVRTILNYLQLVSDKINSQKYDEATEFAGYAKAAASGMDRLLSDLKVYTALGSHPFALSKVSMKQVAADVMKQIKPAADAAEAEISFGELPEITADRQLVEKLLFHLVDNAIKFRRKDKKPVIDIGYDRFEGDVIFCVRDNGIGISKKHYQRIFELFERLNRGEEYPGNGLGLPICKKIIDMHGGDIWVESLPGSGSNFYFTLKGK